MHFDYVYVLTYQHTYINDTYYIFICKYTNYIYIYIYGEREREREREETRCNVVRFLVIPLFHDINDAHI